MASELATRIRNLSIEKIDLANDEAESHLKGYATATLDLDDAADEFSKLAGEDVDQDDIANALVDLADVFDDANLSPEKDAQLNTVVDRLLKTGSDEQKSGAKKLFTATLGYGRAAKAENAYFNELLAADPAE